MPNGKTPLNLLIGLIVVLVLSGLSYFIYSDFRLPDNSPSSGVAPTTSSQSSTSQPVISGVEEISESDLAVENAARTALPDLNRPYVPKVGLPEDIRQKYIKKVESDVETLKSNKLLKDIWLELAIYRKAAEDYKGAEEIWIYVTKIWPLSHTAFANLADLYTYYLKDYAKAEASLLKATDVEPTYVEGYRRLYDLYRLNYKVGLGLDLNILELGLKNNPGNPGILTPLAEYYKERGDKAKARMYYEQALATAQKAGDTGLAQAIEEELKNL